MTKEEKVLAYSMLLDGATYREVADRIGVSKQYIHELFSGLTAGTPGRRAKSIYPNIAEWMWNNRLTQMQTASLVGISTSHWSEILRGKIEPRKTVIDKILAATGLTYEVAFAKKEDKPDEEI